MEKIKKVIAYVKNQTLNELYQKSGMRFAFISAPKDGNMQSTPWVKCRDYLHDAFRAFIHKDACGIYGFSYNAKTDPPIDTRRTRMLVKDDSLSDTCIKKNVLNGVKIINIYEEIAGLKTKTRRYQVSPGIWVINGPNLWLRSPALTSMFTFLLRLGELQLNFSNIEELEEEFSKIKDPNPKNDKDNDLKYLCATWDKMALILENYEAIFLQGKQYEDCITEKKNKLNIDTYHNYMGIKSFCDGKYRNKSAYLRYIEFLKEKDKQVLEHQKKNLVEDNKKQLLRIETEYNDSIYQNYDGATLHMTTVSNPTDGRKQCAPFTKCREHVIASYRASLSQNYKYIAFASHCKTNPVVDTEMTRFLVTVSGVDSGKGKINKAKNELFFAKQVLITYENFFGMVPSIISTVKLKHKEGTSTGWLFTSSSDWIKNPVMFSIYMMIIRTAKAACASIGPLDVMSVHAISKYWKKYYNYTEGKDNNTSICLHHKEMLAVVANRKLLFDNVISRNYFADNGSTEVDYYKRVGFDSLVNSTHLSVKLNTQFKKIKEQLK